MDLETGLIIEQAVLALEESALDLREWAHESVKGGWSTHQVSRNQSMAVKLEREARKLRAVIARAEGREA